MPEFNDLRNHHDFEELVFKILSRTNPFKIDWIDGGRDRGRDIEVYYQLGNRKFKVLVECKFYSKSVNIQDISRSVDWAKVTRPDLLYFWISPYLTPDTKDFLAGFSRNYSIEIDWEDSSNIRELANALGAKANQRFENLSTRIYSHFLDATPKTAPLEYESRVLRSDHFLVDRGEQMKMLLSDSTSKFYVHGLSGSGKTQLVKNIAKTYYDRGYGIFWHSILIEDDPQIQFDSFNQSLADYLYAGHNDDALLIYLREYGNSSINGLVQTILGILSTYLPLVFIDDIHKCKSEDLKYLLSACITQMDSKFFFIGWFNVFDSRISNYGDLKYVQLSGLDKEYLSELLHHFNGVIPSEEHVISLIERYQSLPYYALLSSGGREEPIDLVSTTPTLYLQSLLKDLSIDERIVINTLSISRYSLSIEAFQNFELKIALSDLVTKKLVAISGELCFLHDLLKGASKEFFLKMKVNEPVKEILLKASERNSGILIDLINKLIISREFSSAYDLLIKSFQSLLNDGHDISLITSINQLLKEEIEFTSLMIMKISLLERLGEYKTTLELMYLLDGSFNNNDGKFEEWTYMKLRILYFNSKFDQVIQSISESFNLIVKFSREVFLQIMFLIGRCFYVRGQLTESATIYTALFSRSLLSNKSMVLKSLHRLAMVEESLGFDRNALETFRMISAKSINITKKRKSFALYRISKCHMKMGNFDEALESNKESIRIKETFDHKRGLVFSYKLNGRIFLEKGEIQDALFWAERSFKLAESIGIEKEYVSSGILLIKVLIRNKQEQSIPEIVSKIVPLIIEMGLRYRAEKIYEILQAIDNYLISKQVLNIEKYLRSTEENSNLEIIQKLKSELSPELSVLLENLLQKKSAITPSLLKLTNFKI